VKLIADNIGKKFGRHWIFRNLSYEIIKEKPLAITGSNGAGKSTLLKILSGYLSPSEGKVLIDKVAINDSNLSMSMVSPDLEIIEEFTLNEFLKFHSEFRQPLTDFDEMAEKASLPLNKVIKDFSTGMRQRTKLITLFYFDNDLLFLDEPTSNLDSEGFNWFQKEFECNKSQKLIVLASNSKEEILLCDEIIEL